MISVSSIKSILIFFVFVIGPVSLNGEMAVVIVPVADLTGKPIHHYYKQHTALRAHQALPWAHYKRDYEACPRIHQLLYHEIVKIIAREGDEIQIQIPNLFYQTMMSSHKQNSYWTLKKNVIPLTTLSHKNAELPLPSPITFDKKTVPRAPIVTLTEPYTDPTLSLHFSAGTRFVATSEQPSPDTVMAYCLNPRDYTFTLIRLPSSKVYAFSRASFEKRVTDFVSLLRTWARQQQGIIPYVWGGSSFTERHSDNAFVLKKKNMQGKTLGYYSRPAELHTPKTGYDCSGIIARAAQIVGLPYYYKNTHTIAQQLPALAADESLKEGTIVWIPGHVLVVSDSSNNMLIEASSYDYGYGEVHEIPVGKVFKGIETLHDLKQWYLQKKPLERLHRNGTVLDTYKEVKLLKFARS